MSEHTETSGRPLASKLNEVQSTQGNLINTSSTTKANKQPKVSNDLPSSDGSPKPRTQRRGATSTVSSGPHAGSSRSVQKSAASLNKMSAQMSPVHYTKTGRVSKAKKGLKVHNCHCGRAYTRAEHLRRHQKNHAQEEAILCEFPDCGKPFYRLDLLHRHQERHNEMGKGSRESSILTSSPSPIMPSQSLPDLLPGTMPSISAPTADAGILYHQLPPSPLPESSAPSRYTYTTFRTPDLPQLPRTPHHSFSGPSPASLSSPTSDPNQKMPPSIQRPTYSLGPVPVDATSFMSWNGPAYTQSPPYSSSSSPAPEYNHIFPTHPYGLPTTRTRASSNASFVEQPWCTPQSPMSTNPTIPYTWAQDDKATTGLAYMDTYPVTTGGFSASIHAMAGYGHYSAKTMMRRDEEEGVILFPEQPYGMGHTEQAYPFEQFLNNYWRLFHPTFPVVHRPTFESSMSKSPMLHAAMIAIGGQYSCDTTVKRKSRVLHDRCIKQLEKRTHEPMAEEERIVDFQAIFLVEVLSQYRSRRAAKTLSPRFGTVYHQATLKFQQRVSELSDIMLCLSQPEKATVALWIRWSELTTWQHLLISCYILESQQAMLLAREPHSSMLPVSGLDLPYPTHSLVWDAEDFEAWSSVGVQYSFAPQYVFQALQSESPAAATPYQSALLIAATYNRFGVTASYDSSPTHVDISALLDSSFATHLAFLTARLTQVTPIRALLAVSGESWILSEKVSSPQTFAEYKIILRTWVHQLWSGSSTCDHFNPVKEALELSVTILRLVMDEQIDLCTLEMGTDMGLYFATLTLWTIAAALGARSRHTPRPSQQAFLRRYSESPSTSLLLSEAIHGQTTASYESSQFPEHDELGIAQSQPSSPTRRDSLLTTPLQSHEQIAVTTKTFLVFASHALSMNPLSHSSLSLGNIQAGCEGLLLWTKLCLRSAPVFKDNDSTTWPFAPGDGLGELLDSMVGSIERILGHGWNGWGF